MIGQCVLLTDGPVTVQWTETHSVPSHGLSLFVFFVSCVEPSVKINLNVKKKLNY